MIGGIEIPLWAIGLGLLILASPILLAGLLFFFGKKLGKYRIPMTLLILVGGYIYMLFFTV